MSDDATNGEAPKAKTCHRSMALAQPHACRGDECQAWITAQRPVGQGKAISFTGCLDILETIDAGIHVALAIQQAESRTNVVPMAAIPNLRGH